jgi:hypothetical protein
MYHSGVIGLGLQCSPKSTSTGMYTMYVNISYYHPARHTASQRCVSLVSWTIANNDSAQSSGADSWNTALERHNAVGVGDGPHYHIGISMTRSYCIYS